MKFRHPDQLLMPWDPQNSIDSARAAQVLGCSKDTIRRMCLNGELRFYKLRDLPSSPLHIYYDSVLSYAKKLHERSGLETRFSG